MCCYALCTTCITRHYHYSDHYFPIKKLRIKDSFMFLFSCLYLKCLLLWLRSRTSPTSLKGSAVELPEGDWLVGALELPRCEKRAWWGVGHWGCALEEYISLPGSSLLSLLCGLLKVMWASLCSSPSTMQFQHWSPGTITINKTSPPLCCGPWVFCSRDKKLRHLYHIPQISSIFSPSSNSYYESKRRWVWSLDSLTYTEIHLVTFLTSFPQASNLN